MEEQELERIERYLRQEMPETEQSAFEEKLSADPALQRQVELHAFALKAIRLEGKAALKARLRQRQFHLPGEAKKNAGRRWRWAAAWLGVVLLAVVVWWLNSRESQPSQLPQNPDSTLPEAAPQHTPAQTQPSETSPSNPPAETKETAPNAAPPIAAGKPDPDELFAENFKTFTDAVFESTARSRTGEEKLPPFEQFADFYLKGEHEKALAVYEQIAPAVKNSDNVLFFKANSLLALGRAKEAAALLENIIKNSKSRYLKEATWYLALSYLKQGAPAAAKKLFEKIAGDETSPQQAEAKRLLKQI